MGAPIELSGKRVLIVAATTGYQTRVFADAARALGVEPVLATDRCGRLDDPWGDNAIPVKFDRPEHSAAKLDLRVDGVVAVGDRPAYLAALYAARMGLPFHPPAAVAAARNKYEARERFRSAGLPVRGYRRLPLDANAEAAAAEFAFPVVLKPLGLSGSRGVIRADGIAGFVTAWERIRRILDEPEIRRLHDPADRFVQVEAFIPGREVALEGIVRRGALHVVTIFEKPDPLDGPFFEETIYVAPARETAGITAAARQAVAALGFTDGPVHAEMRANEEGVWMLEAAPRPIGGLCAKAVRVCREGREASLEELVLRAALGEDPAEWTLVPGASGVMMIPIPRDGVYAGVRGEGDAAAVPGITEVTITAKEGQRMRPLPEGSSYLGFLFARGESNEAVEQALRKAHGRLTFDLRTTLPALHPQRRRV
ncbi:MAG: ATP-grasp domain-containing protein [Bryobacteraceae bacterium]